MTKTPLLLSLLASSLIAIACQPGTSESATPGDASPTVDASSISPSDTPEQAESAAVEYEPAYPEEISSAALSSDDVAQQAVPHSHDGDETHSHDSGEEHSDEKAAAEAHSDEDSHDGEAHSGDEEESHDDPAS